MEELDKPKLSITAIVVSAVLTAVVFGGGVYAYQNNKAKKDQEALKSQINALEAEKANLEKQVTNSTSSTTTTQSNTSATSTDSINEWNSFSNSHFAFQLKYPKDWANFANNSNFESEDQSQLFGSTATAAKHKSDDPNARWTFLNTGPVIMLSYGYYNDNAPRAALKSYLGNSDYNAGTITDFTTTSGEKGVKFVGKETLQKQTSEIVIFTLPTRNPVISGHGRAVVFISYSYASTNDSGTSQKLEDIAKTFSITK